MKTLKKGRYYVFGAEDCAWYLNTSGKWRCLDDIDYGADESGPWGLDNSKEIIEKINTIMTNNPEYSVDCYTVKEYEAMRFLMKL